MSHEGSLRRFVAIEPLLDLLLIIDRLEEILLAADGLCEFLYMGEEVPE